MTPADKRRARLLAVTGWAERARLELSDLPEHHVGRVHFRPGATGVTLVGLLPERPQRGSKRPARDLPRLLRELDSRFQRDCVDITQGRETREARLQSWIVAEAYRHEREIRNLTAAAGDTLLFVADELLLTADAGGDIKCDVLAFRTVDGTTGVPVVIELKSRREMTRLIEQVVGYATLVDEHAEEFERLYSAVLGREVRFTGPTERTVIWPAASRMPDPRAEEFAAHGISLVGYEEERDGYRFVID